MTELVSSDATNDLRSGCGLRTRARFEHPHHVVEMFGELDLAGSVVALQMCTRLNHLHVLVDLSGLVFLDCAGFGVLDEARSVLEGRGGSLAIVNPVGEPRRLLGLIESLDG